MILSKYCIRPKRCRDYYYFQHAIWCGYYLRVASIKESGVYFFRRGYGLKKFSEKVNKSTWIVYLRKWCPRYTILGRGLFMGHEVSEGYESYS